MSLGKRLRTRARRALGAVARHPVGRAFERLVYHVNPGPVIVLGNQKAGTSAIAQLLADHCGLSKTVDNPELWPPTMVRILSGRDTLSAFARRHPRPFSRDLIKEPHLTFLHPQLRELCPRARYVFVVRDPRSNIRSILNRLGVPGHLPAFRVEDYEMPEYWKDVFDPRIWGSDHEHYIGVLSDRWRRSAQVYLRQPEEMILLRYEDFLQAKARSIEELAHRLRLTPVHDISGEVDTQFQPRGDHSVPLPVFFGPRNIGMIERICLPEMARFDYHPGEWQEPSRS